MDLYVGGTDSDLCPVATLLSYLQSRGEAPGPLFLFISGCFLTRRHFVEMVQAALARTDVDQRKYCGHSYRIGGVTMAVVRGIDSGEVGECSQLAV